MSKKHKRDVLIARIVFVVFLLIMGALLYKIASWGIGKIAPKPEETEVVVETETEPPFFVIDPNAPETETEEIIATETQTEEVVEETPVEVKAKTNAGVRMRKEANTNCEIVTVLNSGLEVTVLGEEDDWSKVSYGEFTGYIKTEYLTMQ